MLPIDERALVEAHKSGNTTAFAEIVRLHTPGLLNRGYRQLRDLAAAEDAVQETFLRAYRSLLTFDGDYRLGPYLHRILVNVCVDESKRRQREWAKLELVANERVPSNDSLSGSIDDLRDRIQAALDQLSPQYREAVVLREVDGLPYRDVAAMAGVSEENARARVSRARSALRRILTGPAAAAATLAAAGRRFVGPAKSAVTTQPIVTTNAVASSPVLTSPVIAQLVSAPESLNRSVSIGSAVAATLGAAALAVFPAARPVSTGSPAGAAGGARAAGTVVRSAAAPDGASSTTVTTGSTPSTEVAAALGMAAGVTTTTDASTTTTTTTTAKRPHRPKGVVVTPVPVQCPGTLGGPGTLRLGADNPTTVTVGARSPSASISAEAMMPADDAQQVDPGALFFGSVSWTTAAGQEVQAWLFGHAIGHQRDSGATIDWFAGTAAPDARSACAGEGVPVLMSIAGDPDGQPAKVNVQIRSDRNASSSTGPTSTASGKNDTQSAG